MLDVETSTKNQEQPKLQQGFKRLRKPRLRSFQLSVEAFALCAGPPAIAACVGCCPDHPAGTAAALAAFLPSCMCARNKLMDVKQLPIPQRKASFCLHSQQYKHSNGGSSDVQMLSCLCKQHCCHSGERRACKGVPHTQGGSCQAPQCCPRLGSASQWLPLRALHSNPSSIICTAAGSKEKESPRPAQTKTKQQLWGTSFHGGKSDLSNKRPPEALRDGQPQKTLFQQP